MTDAGRLRKKVEASKPGTFLSVSDVPGSKAAIETAFSRLAAEGKLVRVRKGLYWKGVASRFGPGRPSPIDVALEVTGKKGIGPAGWTASHALGLSTQVPFTAELAIPGKPRTAPKGVLFHSRSNLSRLNLGHYEIALLEVLRDWPDRTESDWSALLASVRKLEDKGLLDRRRLARHSDREPPKVRDLIAKLAA
jgi:Family of unknown function (DUF6088)